MAPGKRKAHGSASQGNHRFHTISLGNTGQVFKFDLSELPCSVLRKEAELDNPLNLFV